VPRLFNRVDALAKQYALNSALRFALVALSAFLGGDVIHIVLAWFAASIISGSYLLGTCCALLVRRGLIPSPAVNWLRATHEFPAIWRFLLFSNACTTIGLVLNQGSTILVGAQLGAAAAATWEIARQLAAG
jgi:O-antigen/teichoic acid export membrane protein